MSYLHDGIWGDVHIFAQREMGFWHIKGAISKSKICKESSSRFGSFNLSMMSFCLQRD
jgi:hypothetical protein